MQQVTFFFIIVSVLLIIFAILILFLFFVAVCFFSYVCIIRMQPSIFDIFSTRFSLWSKAFVIRPYMALKQKMDPFVNCVNQVVDPFFKTRNYTERQAWTLLIISSELATRKFESFMFVMFLERFKILTFLCIDVFDTTSIE